MTSPAHAAPDVSLRAAADDDLEAIAALWHRAWPDGHLGHVPDALLQHRGLDDFRRRVPDRLHETAVATIGRRLAGFVMVRENEVEQVYVAREARGGATATILLGHAEGRIAGRFDTAWLAVVPGNARARRFYERNGWNDGGAIGYQAHIPGGTITVPCRRYEKRVGRPR